MEKRIQQLEEKVARLEKVVARLLNHTHVIHWPEGGSPVSLPVTTQGFDLPPVEAKRIKG